MENLICAIEGLTRQMSCLVEHVRKASECCEPVTRNDLHAAEARITIAIHAAKELAPDDIKLLNSLLSESSRQTRKVEQLDAKIPKQ